VASGRLRRNKSIGSYLTSLEQTATNLNTRQNFLTTGLASGSVSEAALSEELTIANKAIQTENFVEGYSGWRISGDGAAEFGSVIVRGDINAYSGTIGYWNITSPAVSRVIGPYTLLGTFVESSATGSNDIDTTSGSYVGLYKSYSPEEIVVTSKFRASNVASLTVENHQFEVGDYVIVSLEDDATFNNGLIPTIITDATNDTFTYANTGSNVAESAATGVVQLYNPDVAGLYLRDYGKSEFDYGFFSNKGVSYVSSPEVNFIYNPSFEYIDGTLTRVGSTNSWVTTNINGGGAVNPSDAIDRGVFTASYATQSTWAVYHNWTTSSGTQYLTGTIDYSEIIKKKYTTAQLPIYFGFDAFLSSTPSTLVATAATANASTVTITTTAAPSSVGIVANDYVYFSFTATDGDGLNYLGGDYSDDKLGRIAKVVTVDNNVSGGYGLTIANNSFGSGGALTLGDLLNADGSTRFYNIHKVSIGALDLSQIRIKFSNNTTVSLSSVVDAVTLDIWTNIPNAKYYYPSDPSSWMLRMSDRSTLPSTTITPLSSPYPVRIDSGALYSAYLTNDPAGFVAQSNIQIDIPNWVNSLDFSAGSVAVSGNKLINSDNLYLVYDSFSFNTVSTPFYGDTAGAAALYSWADPTNKPASVSVTTTGNNWININLDSGTYTLNGLDAASFVTKTFPYTTKSPANINTLMGLGTETYVPDSDIFRDPDLHYLNISSAVLEYPDPVPFYFDGLDDYNTSTRTRSYINAIASRGASGIELSALYELVDENGVLMDQPGDALYKSSIVVYIDDYNKTERIALNGQVDPFSADEITVSKIRMVPPVDVSASSTGHNFQIGYSDDLNLRIDNNEIEALNNGAGASLNLNVAGSGTVVFGGLLDSNDTYANDITTTRRAMWISSAGVMGYASSSRTKKQDIIAADLDTLAILSIEPKHFRYIKAVEEFGEEAPVEIGMIAEDLHDAGLTDFVDYGPDGAIEGIHYTTYVVALQAAVRDLQRQINELRGQ
jgi:hypothetical protein